METRFLETFLRVVERGSLAEAARQLGLTPAAVAQRIHALEQEVGVPLLVRAGRRVAPTAAGALLVDPGRRIVNDVASLRTSVQDEQVVGRLTVGSISTGLTGVMPGTLKKLKKQAPRLEIVLVPGSSPDLFQRVRDRDLDAAILVQPPFVMPKSLQWHQVRRESHVLLAHRDLAHRPVRELLSTQPFLRYDRSSWGGRLVDTYLRRNGIEPRDYVELDALEAVAVMVDHGLGIAIVPRWPRPWPECTNLVELPLEDKALHRPIGLVWRRSSPRQRLIDALLVAVQDGENP